MTEASKNQRYEQRLRDKGLSKITLWIPTDCVPSLMLIAEACRDNRDLEPHMVRNKRTGRFGRVE